MKPIAGVLLIGMVCAIPPAVAGNSGSEEIALAEGETKAVVAAIRVVWGATPEEPDVIIARGFRLAEQAIAEGAQYLVFPENFLHSHNPSDQTIPGPLVERVEAFCRKHNVYVCAGMVESWKFDWRETWDTYLSAVVVGPQGYLSRHRKVDVNMVAYDRLWEPGMPKTDMGVWAGDDFQMHQAGELERIGIMICRDTNTSWAWTRVLTQNPQIVFSPNLRDSVVLYGADFSAMAKLSGVPMVIAVGHPKSESMIINHLGEVVAYENQTERALVAELQLAPRNPALRSFDVIHNTHFPVPEH